MESRGRPKTERAKKTRRRMARDERRAQLLHCALAVFATRGVRRAVHADVAKLADVAVSTVFLYFPTRDDLVDAVLDEVEDYYIELAQQVHASAAPVLDVLREHGRRVQASIDSHPDHALIWMNWGANPRSRVWPRYLDFMARLTAIYRRTIERGVSDGAIPEHVDPAVSARLLVGYAQTAAQLKLANADPAEADQLTKALVGAVLGLDAARAA